ncbi:hypothetical protein [Aquabacterium sp.]|uniref:hypothetical protein n=1 Tax=Aquabacterium sp. TaxID=1872578 RepID=UPI002B6817E5|nr:hypothetical protein [Aquabacterium sp.]HSW05124.1 hypothetical protein [Aquabacterium sp.]
MLRAVLLSLLLLACGYRVWLIVQYNPMDHLWSDPGRHWSIGTRPLDTTPMSAIDPIGYQIYIGILAKITVKQALLVAWWTALLSLAGPWLWYRFLRELLPDRDWALAGWVVLAALPSWSVIYGYFMQETLMLPLLGLALKATWRCRRKADTASFVVAVAIWLAAGLTRGICLPLAAVAMTWLWFAQDGKLPKAAASAVLLLAILGPLAGRSWTLARLISPHGIGQMVHLYHQSGARSIEIEFSRRGGTDRWRYGFTSPAADEAPLAPLSAWRSRREGTVRFAIDLDAGRRDWQAAAARLPPWDASRLAWLTGDNLMRLFFGGSWPDSNRERMIGEVNYASRWLWAPLSLACLVLTVVCWRQQRERLLPALILTWFVVQGLVPLVPNEGRYRKPFEGLLLAQCLLLGATLSQRRRSAAGDAFKPRRE